MTQTTDWAALDALHARYRRERQPGDFTAAEYVERYPTLAVRDATRLLERMVQDGELVKNSAVVGGRITNVYRFPEAVCPSSKPSPSGRNGKKRGQIGG